MFINFYPHYRVIFKDILLLLTNLILKNLQLET